MPELDDASVDLVVTSPPYPMIEMWDASFSALDSDIDAALRSGSGDVAFQLMHRQLDLTWSECARVLKPGGFLCVNIGDATRTISEQFRLYPNHARVTTCCESLGFQSLPPVIWRKQTNAPNKFMGSGMLPSGAYVTLEHEYIHILRKGGKRKFSENEKQRRRKSAFFWEERNVWFSDMWDFKGTRQQLSDVDSRTRSGAFPFDLPWRLVQMFSSQEDLVLDPFLGTGTTQAACVVSARNSLGYELDATMLPVVERTLRDAAGSASELLAERVESHRKFLSKRPDEKKPTYRNLAHGFDVVTKQEVGLEIQGVDGFRRIDEYCFRCEHSRIRGSDQVELDFG